MINPSFQCRKKILAQYPQKPGYEGRLGLYKMDQNELIQNGPKWAGSVTKTPPYPLNSKTTIFTSTNCPNNVKSNIPVVFNAW